jgi:HPt (histidine-containing phosphotransfer) domain-containing protein
MTEKDFKLINLGFLREFCHDDRGKIVNYIHMFLESAPEQMELMKKNAAAKNWKALKTAAHSLKPQIAFMGISSAGPLIEKIEVSSLSDNPSQELPSLLDHLDEALEQSFSELIETLVTLA